MKLIDILVEELPKRGGWPDDADYCIQHAHDLGFRWVIFNKGIVNSASADAEGKWEMDWNFSHKHDFCADELASDHTTAIITREQYEAALAAKNDGWIDWPGGECPVPRGTLVDVKYLCGDVNRHIKAGEPDSSGSIDTAFAVRWSKLGAEYDIIAYRLHQPQGVVQAKADDEADLNECIGQDAAPVWNGEGLPPVGMEIEYSFAKVNYRTDFSRGKVLAYGMQSVFMEHWASKNEFIQPLDKIEFRPIHSEAERKRDEAVEAIDRYMPEFIPDTPNDYYNAKKIYDAIAAGKIPGVKLED